VVRRGSAGLATTHWGSGGYGYPRRHPIEASVKTLWQFSRPFCVGSNVLQWPSWGRHLVRRNGSSRSWRASWAKRLQATIGCMSSSTMAIACGRKTVL